MLPVESRPQTPAVRGALEQRRREPTTDANGLAQVEIELHPREIGGQVSVRVDSRDERAKVRVLLLHAAGDGRGNPRRAVGTVGSRLHDDFVVLVPLLEEVIDLVSARVEPVDVHRRRIE